VRGAVLAFFFGLGRGRHLRQFVADRAKTLGDTRLLFSRLLGELGSSITEQIFGRCLVSAPGGR